MELVDLFRQIETPTFSAMVNVASDFKTFQCAINAQPVFQELLERLNDKETADVVRQRVVKLVKKRVSRIHEHPFDVAVAAYVIALSMWHAEIVCEIAKAVAKSSPVWWWTEYAIASVNVVNLI